MREGRLLGPIGAKAQRPKGPVASEARWFEPFKNASGLTARRINTPFIADCGQELANLKLFTRLRIGNINIWTYRARCKVRIEKIILR